MTKLSFDTWKHLGVMRPEDVGLIMGALKESPNETSERLSVFGL